MMSHLRRKFRLEASCIGRDAGVPEQRDRKALLVEEGDQIPVTAVAVLVADQLPVSKHVIERTILHHDHDDVVDLREFVRGPRVAERRGSQLPYIRADLGCRAADDANVMW